MADPTIAEALRALRLNVQAFPQSRWDPESQAMLVVADLAQQDWLNLLPPLLPIEDQANELAELFERMADRPAVIEELRAQDASVSSVFADALTMTVQSHPYTYLLLMSAEKVSAFIGPFYKGVYARPRPSQTAPGLNPSLPVPGTPSFPQQHGITAYLAANFLGYIIPESKSVFSDLAFQIADNRVIAGLSFPSDVVAARTLANSLFPLILNTPRARQAIAWARAEWADTRVTIVAEPSGEDAKSLLDRFRAADQKMLLIFEPEPGRTLVTADLARATEYLGRLVLHATAIANAINQIGAATPGTLTPEQAFDKALHELEDPPGGTPFEPLAELELLDMGIGSGWLETRAKNSSLRETLFALALGMMPLAQQGAVDVSQYLHRQQIERLLEDVVRDPRVAESDKKKVIDRGFDHLDRMQTEASQRSKCPVPQAMPADQKAKAAVQRAPAALAPAKRPVRR